MRQRGLSRSGRRRARAGSTVRCLRASSSTPRGKVGGPGFDFGLRVPVDALIELWVRELAGSDGEVHVRLVGLAFKELAIREDLVLRAAILTHEPAQVGQAIAAAELPEA